MFQYTPGRPSVARIRGRADAPKSSKKRTCEIESEGVARKRQRKATVADIPKGKSAPPPKKKQKVTNLTDPVLLLRERIRKYGLQSGSYVQIANNEGELWFMRVVNGNVLDPDGDDPALVSAIWCEANCIIRLSTRYNKPVQCEIKTIIDSGPMTKFKALIAKRNAHEK